MELENFVLSFFDSVGNMDFNMFGTILGLILVIFWLVIIGWVWVDSGERTSKKGLRFWYLLLVIVLNIPGLIIYLIVRPSETIEEIYWADLERRYLKYETSELGDCPKCGSQLYPGYVFCTNCGSRIKVRCPKCNVLVDKDHKYCEFCGFQIRERAIGEEKYPDVEVMQKQITASREEATETVESKRTRYKTGHSFVVKLGNALMVPFIKLKNQIREKKLALENRKEEEKVSDKEVDVRKNTKEQIQNKQTKSTNQKSSQKKKKKKKRK